MLMIVWWQAPATRPPPPFMAHHPLPSTWPTPTDRGAPPAARLLRGPCSARRRPTPQPSPAAARAAVPNVVRRGRLPAHPRGGLDAAGCPPRLRPRFGLVRRPRLQAAPPGQPAGVPGAQAAVPGAGAARGEDAGAGVCGAALVARGVGGGAWGGAAGDAAGDPAGHGDVGLGQAGGVLYPRVRVAVRSRALGGAERAVCGGGAAVLWLGWAAGHAGGGAAGRADGVEDAHLRAVWGRGGGGRRGERAKVAVESYDDRIDPVGACVGMKGSRIHGIVRELRNENIDVINYTANSELFIQRALSPAKITSIKINHDKNHADVFLKPDQVSLAIGKGGHNIKLASRLTGFEIDVYRDSEEDVEDVDLEEFADEIEHWIIDELKAIGCDTAKSVLELSKEELAKRTDLEEVTIEEVISILEAEFE